MSSRRADASGPLLIDRRHATLVVVDMQERLLPKVRKSRAMMARVRTLVQAAREFAVPMVLTEHCRESIGPVVAKLERAASGAKLIPKRAFRATAEPEFTAHLVNLGRTQIVLAGLEAHVCVMQTAMGLLDLGYDVFVVEDAVASRTKRDRKCAVERLTLAGAAKVTTEMVLFEWCETGDDRAFSKLLPRIKKLAARQR